MGKIVFNNARDLKLRGHLYNEGHDAIVIMCHGFASDQYANGRFEKLAKELSKHNISALSFDFSGCGESDDAPLTTDNLSDDLEAAIAYVKALGYEKVALFSHSLGAFISLKGYTEAINTMVLLGPLTGPLDTTGAENYTEAQLNEIKEKGYFTVKNENRIRKEVAVDPELSRAIAQINQKTLLQEVTCPILMIHGTVGDMEAILYPYSREAIKLLSSHSRLEIIEGASHSFVEQYDEVLEMTVIWFLKYLL